MKLADLVLSALWSVDFVAAASFCGNQECCEVCCDATFAVLGNDLREDRCLQACVENDPSSCDSMQGARGRESCLAGLSFRDPDTAVFNYRHIADLCCLNSGLFMDENVNLFSLEPFLTTSPTSDLTLFPTTAVIPTPFPTPSPTDKPTISLTLTPTRKPTVSPTANPTASPTLSLTQNPTDSPTVRRPTTNPTTTPTIKLTISPFSKGPTASSTGVEAKEGARFYVMSGITTIEILLILLILLERRKVNQLIQIIENPWEHAQPKSPLQVRHGLEH